MIDKHGLGGQAAGRWGSTLERGVRPHFGQMKATMTAGALLTFLVGIWLVTYTPKPAPCVRPEIVASSFK
jgi:hypothetical protein